MKAAVVTLTLNPAVDRTVAVDGWVPGGTNRATVLRVDPGGKGLNVARVTRRLGLETWALGLVGEENAALFHRMLAREGIRDALLEVPGETRLNLKILDRQRGLETEVNETGFAVPPEALERLERRLEEVWSHCAALILAGSLPPGVPDTYYADLVRRARAAGLLVVLDASGEPLRHGLAAGPGAVKPNRPELEEVAGGPLRDLAAVRQAAASLRRAGAGWVLVSLGAEGALLCGEQGAWHASPPPGPVGSTVGAGDAMVAALVHGLLSGFDPERILRRAVAAGTATARRPGTELCTAEEIESLEPAVQVRAL